MSRGAPDIIERAGMRLLSHVMSQPAADADGREASGGRTTADTSAAEPPAMSCPSPAVPDVGPVAPRMIVPNRVILALYACVIAGAEDPELYAIARMFRVDELAYRFWRFRNDRQIAELRRQNEGAR